MNLFTYRKMEEDHFTNILMNILLSNSYSLVPAFINRLIETQSKEFDYRSISIELFSRTSTQSSKPHEYIIGIAPYESAVQNELENNMDSIPDAWIYGNNFTLLFEFKIRGSLDEAQLSAHKRKLVNYKGTHKFRWENVIDTLEEIRGEATEVQKFLIDEFISISYLFKSKRPSSGMPKAIIGGRSREGELYFIITGSKETKSYTVDIVFSNGTKKRLVEKINGIQPARRWIANFIYEKGVDLPLSHVNEETIISDLCVKPGRLNNSWNQWRLGSYVEKSRDEGV
ncbi:hypothetical protein [Virgibacillus sp. DJP39]|uniref:hypothetical protein n=1 Tax=Virgibacillus sp. DJP39 TaxID=3409790 RepID=UPI003BB5EEA6